MKRVIVLFAILLTSLFFTQYAAAQPLSLVEIWNRSGENRKICMYREQDTFSLNPYKCFLLNPNQKVVWNRNGNRSIFKVKVLRSSQPRLLNHRRLPGNTNRIVMNPGNGFGFDYVPPKRNQP